MSVGDRMTQDGVGVRTRPLVEGIRCIALVPKDCQRKTRGQNVKLYNRGRISEHSGFVFMAQV